MKKTNKEMKVKKKQNQAVNKVLKKKKTKENGKNIGEMSAEEFMMHGLSSDDEQLEIVDDNNEVVEDNEEEILDEETVANDNNESGEASKEENNDSVSDSSHKKQLSRLKDKDPEFFKFLQENDEGLLEFSDSEAEGELDEEEEKGDDGPIIEDDGENIDKEEGIVLTQDHIDKWKKRLEKNSIKCLKTLLKAFYSAVESLSPADENSELKKKGKYVVSNSLFNNLVALCLKYSAPLLEKHLDYAKGKNNKRVQLPSSSKQWTSVKGVVKLYLSGVLQLLRQLTDASMLTIILRHCQSLCQYYACFPKIGKMFIKRLIRMWSSAEEHVRVVAFLCVRKSLMLTPNLFDFVLKKMYLSFVRCSKFVNSKSQPLIQFMQNSLVEVCSLNHGLTYQHAFVYIRQLSIHLRNAITTKKQDPHQAVYNWQYLSCLQLWAQVVATLHSGGVLKPLVYPVVQITLGVIKLIPSARYFPIRFKCIQILNTLSEKTEVYIPTAAYVLEALESEEFERKPRSTEKPPHINAVLKFTKPQLLTKAFHDITIDTAFEVLLNHYVLYSHSIAFPELIFPVCRRLRRLIKKTKSPKLSKDMKVLVDKIESHGDSMSKLRSQISFSPKDFEKVEKWESLQKEKPNSLQSFYESWKKLKTNEEDKFDNDANDDETEKPKKTKKRKPKNTKEVAPKKAKVVATEASEDIVEDIQFSDSESD